MPDSYGKRQRREAKAKKAAAREDRRVARAKRDADRAAGLIPEGTPIEASDIGGFEEGEPGDLATREDGSAPTGREAPDRPREAGASKGPEGRS